MRTSAESSVFHAIKMEARPDFAKMPTVWRDKHFAVPLKGLHTRKETSTSGNSLLGEHPVTERRRQPPTISNLRVQARTSAFL